MWKRSLETQDQADGTQKLLYTRVYGPRNGIGDEPCKSLGAMQSKALRVAGFQPEGRV